MTTFQAAQAVRRFLIERYALENEPEINLPVVWSTARSDESGFEWARGCVNVVWESSDAECWPMEITEAIYLAKYGPEDHGGDTLDLKGIFCEPATDYALSFYPA